MVGGEIVLCHARRIGVEANEIVRLKSLDEPFGRVYRRHGVGGVQTVLVHSKNEQTPRARLRGVHEPRFDLTATSSRRRGRHLVDNQLRSVHSPPVPRDMHLEVGRLKVQDRLAVAINHMDVHRDEVDVGPERGLLYLKPQDDRQGKKPHRLLPPALFSVAAKTVCRIVRR